jgi:hypothetical protein
MPFSLAIVNMLLLVTPSSAPQVVGGVARMLSFTTNIFSALASTTVPAEFSIIASSKPALIASTLASTELA